MFSTESSQKCQSRHFKEWHPDYIGSYNSLDDPHLRHFFRHPQRRVHLTYGSKQVKCLLVIAAAAAIVGISATVAVAAGYCSYSCCCYS